MSRRGAPSAPRQSPDRRPRPPSEPIIVTETETDTAPEPPRRFVLCLVADDEAVERFPEAVRFLQVGLIDEPIDVILVVPQRGRARSLAIGSTVVIPYRKAQWPFDRWARRQLIDRACETIDGFKAEAGRIVHALSVSAAPPASAIASAAGADLVVTVSAPAALHDPRALRWLTGAAALAAPAEAIRREANDSPLASKRVEVIPPGIMAGESPAAFRNPDEAPTLLFAGELTAATGVDILLRAVERVLRRRPDLQLFLLGKGPAEAGLRSLAAALKITSNVTFAGRLDEQRRAMEAADLFCIPRAVPVYREEPLQAMAAGLAIVSAEGTLCEGLVDRQTAFFFPDGSAAELADRLVLLLERPETARTLAATAQAFVRSHHALAGMVGAFLRLYRDLIGRHETLPLPPRR